jgi:hypothetical protein
MKSPSLAIPAQLMGCVISCSRHVLCSHLLDAVSVAPAIMIVGPDAERAKLLMTLLRCLCRHALLLTRVTPAGFCSLASGARFTYLIRQANVSDKLRKLLDDASSRDRKIPFRGRLLDLFGVQIVHSDGVWPGDSWPLRAIKISMIPTGEELRVFDSDAQRRITDEFQAKLLSFRRLRRIREGLAVFETIAARDSKNRYASSGLAVCYFDLGQTYSRLATRARFSSAQKEDWYEARKWFQKSADIWSEKSSHGALEDSERGTAQRAAKGIAKCNTALSGLEGIREPRT